MEEWGNIPKSLLSLFSSVPTPARRLIATGVLLFFLFGLSVALVDFAATNDPLLRRPARYIKLVIMCASVVATLFVAVASLFDTATLLSQPLGI